MLNIKRISILSNKVETLNGHQSLNSLVGKKVYSKSGDHIGKVKDVLYLNTQISGITVWMGLRKLFIDREFFGDSPDDVLFLTIDPIFLLMGKQVFDVNGRLLGKVSAIKRNSTKNLFNSLIVKKNIISKPLEVKHSDIQTMKVNIILNISIEPPKGFKGPKK